MDVARSLRKGTNGNEAGRLVAQMMLIAFAATACGTAGSGDSEPTTVGQMPEPRQGRPTPETDEDPDRSVYRGSLHYSDSALEFTVESCHYDPEDMSNRNVRLVVEGAGVDGDGQRLDVKYVSVFDGSRRLER